MRLRLLFLFVFGFGLNCGLSAQLNNYKYIVVPKKFDAYNTENKHQTSTSIKHLFIKKGFNAVYDDELPEELGSNRCLGLMVDLLDNSNMFTTKTTLVLKDCQGIEVYKSIEGKSKIKEYRAAFRDALQKAFAPIQAMNYKYVKNEDIVENRTEEPIKVSFKNDVKKVEDKTVSKVVVQEATPENQSFKSTEPKPSTFKKAEKVVQRPVKDLLYAQPTEKGYQLIDSEPKVVLKLIKTSVDNIFLVDDLTKNGMVYKKGDKWFLEYTEGSDKKLQELHIKF